MISCGKLIINLMSRLLLECLIPRLIQYGMVLTTNVYLQKWGFSQSKVISMKISVTLIVCVLLFILAYILKILHYNLLR